MSQTAQRVVPSLRWHAAHHHSSDVGDDASAPASFCFRIVTVSPWSSADAHCE